MFATLHAGIGVKQTHSYARSLFFPVRSVDVKTTVKPGRTMVFVGGGLSQKESGNKTLLVFVTVNGVSADIQ